MTAPATCPTCKSAIPPDSPDGACPRCMLAAGLVAATVPTADEVAAKLPAFEIVSVLGQGGMGVVFKARQKTLDRVVALKVLPSAAAAAPGFAERFAREAKAMARLQHPNIVAVHDSGESDGLFWLVMEYVDGVNIREAMRGGRIAPKEALAIVPQICDALQYAHEHGVVHRDIKPENVLLDKTGRVKVADFGLAKLMETTPSDRTLTDANQVMGTPHYMAPEQIERPADVDHRADIYSLGVVFYEMLTGELPLGRFAAPSRRVQIDVRLDEIVLRTLEKSPERRYQQASQVKTDVGTVTDGSTTARFRHSSERSADAVPAVRRWSRLIDWAAACALAACTATCWMAWNWDGAVLVTTGVTFALFGLRGTQRMHIGPGADALDEQDHRHRVIGHFVLGATLLVSALVGRPGDALQGVTVGYYLGSICFLVVAFVRRWNPWVLLLWGTVISGPLYSLLSLQRRR